MMNKTNCVDLNTIRSKLSYRKITQKEAAKNLGISRESFNHKINGKTEFSVREISKLALFLNEDIKIFFTP